MNAFSERDSLHSDKHGELPLLDCVRNETQSAPGKEDRNFNKYKNDVNNEVGKDYISPRQVVPMTDGLASPANSSKNWNPSSLDNNSNPDNKLNKEPETNPIKRLFHWFRSIRSDGSGNSYTRDHYGDMNAQLRKYKYKYQEVEAEGQ